MIQKRCALVLISFLLSILLIGIISAEPGAAPSTIQSNIKSVVDKVVEVFQPISEAVLGQKYESGTDSSKYFFARILFFIIILVIIFLALERVSFFNEHTFALWIISAAVAVLGTRYFVSDDWIKTILLPYETLGVVIAAGLPFVIYFIIVEFNMRPNPPILRKIAWIFFAVVFTGLWISRSDANDLGNSGAIWIYPITAALAIAMVVMDGTLTKFWAKVDIEKSQLDSKKRAMRELKRELDRLHTDYSRGLIKGTEYLTETKQLEKRIIALSKYM
jgi:hypothetical protein